MTTICGRVSAAGGVCARQVEAISAHGTTPMSMTPPFARIAVPPSQPQHSYHGDTPVSAASRRVRARMTPRAPNPRLRHAGKINREDHRC